MRKNVPRVAVVARHLIEELAAHRLALGIVFHPVAIDFQRQRVSQVVGVVLRVLGQSVLEHRFGLRPLSRLGPGVLNEDTGDTAQVRIERQQRLDHLQPASFVAVANQRGREQRSLLEPLFAIRVLRIELIHQRLELGPLRLRVVHRIDELIECRPVITDRSRLPIMIRRVRVLAKIVELLPLHPLQLASLFRRIRQPLRQHLGSDRVGLSPLPILSPAIMRVRRQQLREFTGRQFVEHVLG